MKPLNRDVHASRVFALIEACPPRRAFMCEITVEGVRYRNSRPR